MNMLRVTVELFPHGSVSGGRILSQTYIVNDGTGTFESGNYTIGTDAYVKVKYKGFNRSKGHRLLVAKALQLLDKENLK